MTNLYDKMEKYELSDILSKHSVKKKVGMRWQKRKFKLYNDRIVYSDIKTKEILGTIPLIAITKMEANPKKNHKRFNVLLDSCHKFELQATTQNINCQ